MPQTRRMNFKIGSPVTGTNYFPRTDITEELVEAFEEDHILFLAPRRTGKTSILFNLRDNRFGNFDFFFLNLEGFNSPSEWIAAMMELLLKDEVFHSLIKSVSKSIKVVIEQINRIESVKGAGFGLKLRKAVEADWKSTADNLLDKLSKMEHPVVFLLDEFPTYINNLNRNGNDAEGLLRWFRASRQEFENRKNPVKFLLTGSIGLDGIVRRMGVQDAINDFHSIDLPPFTNNQAVAFLSQLGKDNGLNLTKKAHENILELVGSSWPYFLQIFLSEIKKWKARYPHKRMSGDELLRMYQERIVFGPKNKYLPHMFDRLKDILNSKELSLARGILKECAMSGNGLHPSKLPLIHKNTIKDDLLREEGQLSYVLDVLKHDGYITQSTLGYRKIDFFSNMLRDYWRGKIS